MDYLIVAPDPAGTVESLTALGYSLEAAVADLVDNSIDAGAENVDVVFHWAGFDSHVAVIDDGRGMGSEGLRDAMALALRGPTVRRDARELGRFGMGLKTASFAQARLLVVWSRQEGAKPAVRVWDLDRVASVGQWQLLTDADEPSWLVLGRLLEEYDDARTIVLWRKLTRIVEDVEADDEVAQRYFLDAVARVHQHLAVTFARFLAARPGRRRLRLRVNGADVEAWDPFLESHPGISVQPVEHLQVDGHAVLVRPFVLPPKRRLTDEQYRDAAGARGWLDQQGFYIYRNDRLIVAGDWLDLRGLRKDEKHSLARIGVDIPAVLDHLWSVDVKKATARPPLPLRKDLTRIARATRAQAQRVQASLSRTTALTSSDDLSYVWRPERTDSQLRLRLNWDHPLVKEALAVEPHARRTVRALLRYLEETVPLPALRIMFDADRDRDHEPFSDGPPTEVVKVADRLYAAYINRGLSPAQARTRLTHTYPFNEYADLLSSLNLAATDQEGGERRG